jgi:hypothetical protein
MCVGTDPAVMLHDDPGVEQDSIFEDRTGLEYGPSQDLNSYSQGDLGGDHCLGMDHLGKGIAEAVKPRKDLAAVGIGSHGSQSQGQFQSIIRGRKCFVLSQVGESGQGGGLKVRVA